MEKEKWEREFDNKFVNEICYCNGKSKILDNKTGYDGWLYYVTPRMVKQFIQEKLTKKEKK